MLDNKWHDIKNTLNIDWCRPIYKLKSAPLTIQPKTFYQVLTFHSQVGNIGGIWEGDRVHIVDLDIMQDLQWPDLFHILASRPKRLPYVWHTGLGTSMEALEATVKRLSNSLLWIDSFFYKIRLEKSTGSY